MPRILITSGPTREYLDPVRYLTNASSGQMGAALARAALGARFEVTVVSGPVAVEYPPEAQVVRVVSTAEMLQKAAEIFPECIGVIGVAAPCDFTPVKRSATKMTKDDLTRAPASISPEDCGRKTTFSLELTETPDILAALGKMKTANQWSVAFALETHDFQARALKKLVRKNADLIALNRPSAIGSGTTRIELLASDGPVASFEGDKPTAAKRILEEILRRFPR